MPFKISGVELVRRLRLRVPEYEQMAEHCLVHAKEIKETLRSMSEIAGHSKMPMIPDPDEVWQIRADSYKARASDLQWLSDSIIQNEMHEVSGEELLTLGIIGATGGSMVEMLGNESGE